jgi:hypothetical protein
VACSRVNFTFTFTFSILLFLLNTSVTYCRDPADKLIRHRACSLRDTAYTLIKAEMDSDFEEQCKEISRARKRRAESPSRFAPEFVHTKPKSAPVATDEGWIHCYVFTCLIAFLL